MISLYITGAIAMVGLPLQAVSLNISSIALGAQHCSGRGGCDCDCSWASSSTCGHDDGSCCFGCCCHPGPSPPLPPPTPSPTPPGPPTPTPPGPHGPWQHLNRAVMT